MEEEKKEEEREVTDDDGVWRAFLAIRKKVPGGKFAPLKGTGVCKKNQLALVHARFQRERER